MQASKAMTTKLTESRSGTFSKNVSTLVAVIILQKDLRGNSGSNVPLQTTGVTASLVKTIGAGHD